MTKQKDRKLTVEELDELKAAARKHDAEARRADAEADKAKNESARAVEWCKMETIARKTKELEYEEVLAQDIHHQVYNFTFPVGASTVRECMETLNLWHRTKPKCDMEIVFTSPGGSVIEGLALFDYIQQLKRKGHKITTSTLGMAASMAGVLLQAGTERVAGKESWVLIHEGSFGAIGDVGKVEDMVAWVKRIGERIVDIFAERAAKKLKKPEKDVAAFIRKNWHRRDWWLSSDECLQHGFIDRIE